MAKLTGTNPDQVPTNADLGTMAYQDKDNVNVGSFTSNGIDDNATSTAMTLDTSGNLLVGTTSYNSDVQGVGIGADAFFYVARQRNTANTSQVATFNRKGTDGNITLFQKDGTTVGSIGSRSSVVSYIVLDPRSGVKGAALVGGSIDANNGIINPGDGTGDVDDASIDLGSSGARFKDLYLSGGVYLGGTGAANKLDDYEEGTWTPTTSFAGNSDGITYSSREGVYTKVGRLVTAMIRVGLSNNGTATTGLFQISLPFIVNNAMGTTSVQGSAPVGFMSGFSGTHYDVQAVPWEGESNVKLYYRTTTTGAANTAAVPDQISNSFDCRITVQFMTNA